MEEDDEIVRGPDFDAQIMAAAKPIFDVPLYPGVNPDDALLVGEPGDGADIDMDTFEHVSEAADDKVSDEAE